VYLEPDGSKPVRRVTYLLDGNPFSTDFAAPFDFAGTSYKRPCWRCPYDAYPFESNLLSLGEHLITAVILFKDGTGTTIESSFTVTNTTPHQLLVSSSAGRSAPVPLDGATLSGRQYLFLGPADDPIVGKAAVIFRIDGKLMRLESVAPYDISGTRRDGTANAFDTRRLRNGPHEVTALVVLNGTARILYSADFRVAN
jgi:hypothetical protein